MAALVLLAGCEAEEPATTPVEAGGGGGGGGGSSLISVTPTTGTTDETGGSATFNVVLSIAPTANVTIPLSSTNTAEGTVSVASLTFTSANYNVPQTVTVTGVDDFAADGNVAYQVQTGPATSTDTNFNGQDAADVGLVNQDNDSANILLSATSGLVTTEGLATDTFTVVLTSQPSANVSFNLASSDTSEATVSPGSLTFTNANWSTPQTVTLTGVNDLLADGNVTYFIVPSAATSTDPGYNGLNAAVVTAINNDNDIVVNILDRGWWDDTGAHTSTNSNSLTGWSGQGFRSFYLFDLSGVVGTFTQASMHIFINAVSGITDEVIGVWDVTTGAAALDATSTGQIAIYNDLGSGTQFGAFLVSPGHVGTFRDFPLNGSAVTAINGAIGGSFAVGFNLETCTCAGTEWVRPSGGGEAATSFQLILAR